jgi:hypothetical protein
MQQGAGEGWNDGIKPTRNTGIPLHGSVPFRVLGWNMYRNNRNKMYLLASETNNSHSIYGSGDVNKVLLEARDSLADRLGRGIQFLG